MENRFKVALEWIDNGTSLLKNDQEIERSERYRQLNTDILAIHDTIREALLIAAKLMQEPSGALVQDNWNCERC